MARSAPVRPAATFGLVTVITLALGSLGLVVAEWRWAGLCAGLVGVALSAAYLHRIRSVGALAPLGLFSGLTLVEGWVLWAVREDSEVVDTLVVMGAGASLCGLFVGGLASAVLEDRWAAGPSGRRHR